MQHVFLIGSKGIPAHYGDYETFVERLTKGKSRSDLHYHVACMGKDTTKKTTRTRLFSIKVPFFGSAGAIYYDDMRHRYFLHRKLYFETNSESVTRAYLYILHIFKVFSKIYGIYSALFSKIIDFGSTFCYFSKSR